MPARTTTRRNKYRNTPVYACENCGAHFTDQRIESCTSCGCQGLAYFASKKEFHRWRELALMQRAGKINRLRRQVRYPVKINGLTVFKYVADADYYTDQGRHVIEDTKGMETAVFKLKRKAFEAYYGIPITIT